MLETIRSLFAHLAWADTRLLEALGTEPVPHPEALLELAHGIGASEVWLSRLEARAARAPVWPEMTLSEVRELAGAAHEQIERFLDRLDTDGLSRPVTYTNSAGARFTNSVEAILLHMALHAQYHRGKVNLLLRQAGQDPAPVDFIAFVRGASAATRDRA